MFHAFVYRSSVEFDYGIDYDGRSSNDTSDSDCVAEVTPPMLDLSSPILEQITALNPLVNPLAVSTVMAVDIYVAVLQILLESKS